MWQNYKILSHEIKPNMVKLFIVIHKAVLDDLPSIPSIGPNSQLACLYAPYDLIMRNPRTLKTKTNFTFIIPFKLNFSFFNVRYIQKYHFIALRLYTYLVFSVYITWVTCATFNMCRYYSTLNYLFADVLSNNIVDIIVLY